MLGLLLIVVFKTLVLAFALVIFMLSGRRLLYSKSANAWLYGATAVFAFLTILGLMPWVLGLGRSHPVFFVLAAAAPVVWYGVVSICDEGRETRFRSELERALLRLAALVREGAGRPPLVLRDPVPADMPTPVFRHTPTSSPTPESVAPARSKPRNRPLVLTDAVAAPAAIGRARMSEATATLLGVAREMRRNASSEGRRPKLLAAPRRKEKAELSYLRVEETV